MTISLIRGILASYDNDCQALLKRNPTGVAKACNRPLEGENFRVTTALERLGSVFKNAEGEVAVLRTNDDGFDWPDNVPPSAHGASQRRRPTGVRHGSKQRPLEHLHRQHAGRHRR